MTIFMTLLDDVVDFSIDAIFDGKGGWNFARPDDGKAGWDRTDGKAGW